MDRRDRRLPRTGQRLSRLRERWRRWVEAHRRLWPARRDALRRRLATLTWPPVRRRIAILAGAGTAVAVPDAIPFDSTGLTRVFLMAFVALIFGVVIVGQGFAGVLKAVGEVNQHRGPVRALVFLTVVLGGALAIAWLVVPHRGLLPAALLLLVGAWACVLTNRRLRAARLPGAARVCVDTLAVLFIALAIIVVVRKDLAVTEPAAALLFAPAAWAALRTWRALSKSDRLPLRAAADIVLSLLLGALLVTALVWLANALALPTAEVATLRGVLSTVDLLVDLPWWTWTIAYVVLAAVSIALALLPGRLGPIRRPWKRWRIPARIDIARRAASGVHIGLMLTVLIGLAAPPVLAAVDAHVRPKYALALQRQLEAQAEQAAYQRIAQAFTAPRPPPAQIQPLTDLFTRIHSASEGAPDTERSLARRLGRIQSAALLLGAAPAPLDAETELSEPARYAPPATDARDLTARLDQLADQQTRADTATSRVQQAADLAAVAIATAVQAPTLGGSQLVQLAKEYLQGLIESSPLKDLLTRYAAKLPTAPPPPPPQQQVVPDPAKLLIVAYQVRLQTTLRIHLTDPLTPDPVLQRAQQESPLDATVDLTNETRYLEEQTGPCHGCPQPIRPGEEPRIGPEHAPGRGPAEHPPPIHIR